MSLPQPYSLAQRTLPLLPNVVQQGFSAVLSIRVLYACYTRGTERELYVFLLHCQQKCYPESLGHVVWKTKLRIAQMQLINVSPIANSTKNGMARRYPLMPPCLSINYLAIMATSSGTQMTSGVFGARPITYPTRRRGHQMYRVRIIITPRLKKNAET